MTAQPTALRLAELIDKVPYRGTHEAAAELRRLHEELAVTVYQVEFLSDDLSQAASCIAELLKVLEYIQMQTHLGHIHDTASAAITKATGEQT